MALLASAARVPRRAPLPWCALARHAHFDSNAFVQRLEKAGITRQQADVLVTALTDVINESAENIARGLVRRDEAERLNYTQKVDFAKLKSEIQLLERSDFVLMKSENERLMADVEKLKQRLREEIARTTAGVRLDLNLEKGRIRDESSVHALKIKEVDTRIESEIAGVRTSIQSAKFNVLQVRCHHLLSTSLVSLRVRVPCSSHTCACSASAPLFCTWIDTIRTALGTAGPVGTPRRGGALLSSMLVAPGGTSITTHPQYITDGLDESALLPRPMDLFQKWFHEVQAAGVPEPEAMTLSTTALPGAPPPAASAASADKAAWRVHAPRPSSRTVLLKGADEHGFYFYTNYSSRKGDELAANPWCALSFYWPAVHRAVRVLGRAEQLPRGVSQAYYSTRPVGSQIGAWASPQSAVLPSRAALEERVQACEHDLRAEYGEVAFPVPPFWGGYRVVPDEIEFWIGRESRLHDRYRYVRSPHTDAPVSDAASWTIERLAP